MQQIKYDVKLKNSHFYTACVYIQQPALVNTADISHILKSINMFNIHMMKRVKIHFDGMQISFTQSVGFKYVAWSKLLANAS